MASFFTMGLGKGFAQGENQDLTNYNNQQDQLTQLTLKNILNNVNTYNQQKQDYSKRVQQASAAAQVTGGNSSDALAMINANIPQAQMMSALARSAANKTAGSTSAQTTAAISSGNATTDTSTAAPAPVNTQMPQASSGSASSDNSGIWGTLFGQPNINQNAMKQAGQVTGLSGDQLNQASTGVFTPPQTQTSGNGTPLFNESNLVDWSKFDASRYPDRATMQQAADAYARGDVQTAERLANTLADKTAAELKIEAAKKAAETSTEATSAMRTLQAKAALLVGTPDPDDDNKPFTMQSAVRRLVLGVNAGGMGQSINPMGLTGEDYLASLNDPAEASLIRSYASGAVPVPRGTGKGGVQAQQELLQKITAFDPSFNAQDYEARSRALRELTSGKDAANIVAIGTSLGHLGNYVNSMDALNNGWSPIGNAIANERLRQTGDGRIAAAERDMTAVAPELAKAFRGGSDVNEADIQEQRKTLSINQSKDQYLKSTKEAAQLLEGRLDNLAAKVNGTFGTQFTGLDLMSKQGKLAYFKALGITPHPDDINKPYFLDQLTARRLPPGTPPLNPTNPTVTPMNNVPQPQGNTVPVFDPTKPFTPAPQ